MMRTQALQDPMPPGPAPRGGSGWSRLFGFDAFISFALGPAPRGSRAYASDLARRLRESGFTVFYSEDEAPVGAQLDRSLLRALRRSRLLVVVCNHGTLSDPRWVRSEVEAFRKHQPASAVIPINVDRALQDLKDLAQPWLQFEGRIWIDEDAAQAAAGQVSDSVVDRLVSAPHAIRSMVRLRIAVTGLLLLFAGLAALAGWQWREAVGQRNEARQSLLGSAAQRARLLVRDGRAEEGWAALVEALRQADPDVQGPWPAGFLTVALTTRIEDRRGPALRFDIARAPAPLREEGDITPPPAAFDASGRTVAIAADRQVAIWRVQDGVRLAQLALPFRVSQLDFAAQGDVLVAQGRDPPTDAANQVPGVARAVAIDVASGRSVALPLQRCFGWVPCVGHAPAGSVQPMSQLPPFRLLELGFWPEGVGFTAAAADGIEWAGVAGSRWHLLLQTGGEGGPDVTTPPLGGVRAPIASARSNPGVADASKWWLFDSKTRRAQPLEARLEEGDVEGYVIARDAPVLVAYSRNSGSLLALRADERGGDGRVRPWRAWRATQAGATRGHSLSPDGSLLRYENDRFGTGTGVGVGRTVLLELATGRERWARGEGAVEWGNALVALQEDWADTQVLAADTGATWFNTPGRPLAFDPADQALLLWHPEPADPRRAWPEVWLVDALPLRQLGRDLRGPASTRSACVEFGALPFLTLTERGDRRWSQGDWQRAEMDLSKAATARQNVASTGAKTKPPAATPLGGDGQRTSGRWRWRFDGDEQLVWLTNDALTRLLPAVAGWLAHQQGDLTVSWSRTPDGQFQAVTAVRSSAEDAPVRPGGTCPAGAWSLWRAGERAALREGCVDGELQGPGEAPRLQFVAPTAGAVDPWLALVPTASCRYDLLALDGRDPGRWLESVVPIFSRNVQVERRLGDMLVVSSSDWHGATMAWQWHALGQPGDPNGPVLILADRNTADDLGPSATAGQRLDPAASLARQPLFDASALFRAAPESDQNFDVTVSGDGARWVLEAAGKRTVLAVPPWGQRLVRALRAAVTESRVVAPTAPADSAGTLAHPSATPSSK